MIPILLFWSSTQTVLSNLQCLIFWGTIFEICWQILTIRQSQHGDFGEHEAISDNWLMPHADHIDVTMKSYTGEHLQFLLCLLSIYMFSSYLELALKFFTFVKVLSSIYFHLQDLTLFWWLPQKPHCMQNFKMSSPHKWPRSTEENINWHFPKYRIQLKNWDIFLLNARW